MSKIPPRLSKPIQKDRRFYVIADSAVYLALQKEAHARDTDLWTLCGSVLTAWLDAGCPLSFDPHAPGTTSLSPPPSSSPLASNKDGAQ